MRGVANGSGARHRRLHRRAADARAGDCRRANRGDAGLATGVIRSPCRPRACCRCGGTRRSGTCRGRAAADHHRQRPRLCRARPPAARARALAMLPGIDGHLLSSAFIEQLLPPGVTADAAASHRALSEWRRRWTNLGPSSTPRALLHAAGPWLAVRGLERASRIEPTDPALAATLQSAGAAVALLIIPWGDVR